jgi:hypothetical protein
MHHSVAADAQPGERKLRLVGGGSVPPDGAFEVVRKVVR